MLTGLNHRTFWGWARRERREEREIGFFAVGKCLKSNKCTKRVDHKCCGCTKWLYQAMNESFKMNNSTDVTASKNLFSFFFSRRVRWVCTSLPVYPSPAQLELSSVMTPTAVWTTVKPERLSLKWQTEKQIRPTASKFLFSFSFYGRLTGCWSYKKLGEGQTCFSAVGGEGLPTVPSQAERSRAAAHSMFPAAGTRLGKTRETRRNTAVESTRLFKSKNTH